MTNKIFCLLSGGIDSTTTLVMAREDFPDAEIECISVDYGQRHQKEIYRAASIARMYGAEHTVVNLQGLMEGMLVDKGEKNEQVPDVSYADLPQGISPTYVTFRNGLMLSVVAARAQAWVMQEQRDWKIVNGAEMATKHPNGWDIPEEEQPNAYIYCGVHADDGANWAYPDCTPEFIGGMANAIHIGTYNRVRLRAPLLYMSKAEVVRIGTRLGAPYEKTWSCYKGEDLHCGVCPTCRSRKEAFELIGAEDPTEYAQ